MEEMWKYSAERDYPDEDGEEKGFTFGSSSGNRSGSQHSRFSSFTGLGSNPSMFFSRCPVVELERAGALGSDLPKFKSRPGAH